MGERLAREFGLGYLSCKEGFWNKSVRINFRLICNLQKVA